MKLISRLLAVLVLFGWAGSANANLVTFKFEFDTAFNGIPLELPIVGRGQVSFDDPGNGSFLLSTLSNLSIEFFVFDELFTQTDNQTPINQVLAVISDFGSARRFQFSNINAFGSGPYFGSVDFVNENGIYLTFQPPAFGESGPVDVSPTYDLSPDFRPPPTESALDLYYAGSSSLSLSGSYLGISAAPMAIPLPGTFAMLVSGLVLLRLTRRARAGGSWLAKVRCPR